MNIAFTTILIFLIVSPGFLFRITFYSSKHSIKYTNKNLINELTWSIIPAIIIHAIAISFFENCTKYYVDFKILGNLILGVTSPNKVEECFTSIRSYLLPILAYNFSVISLSIFLGFASHYFIRFFKLDRKYVFLRFSNKWHYIFTGECLDFPDVPDKFEEISKKTITVLCKVNGKSILYTGEYFDYFIDNCGNLEAVHMKYPIRRYIENDNIDTSCQCQNSYYTIPSRFIIIPSSEIININFRYFNLQEVSKNEVELMDQANIISI